MSDPIRFTVSSHLIDHERMSRAIVRFYRDPGFWKRILAMLAVIAVPTLVLQRQGHPEVMVMGACWMALVIVMSYAGSGSAIKARLQGPGSAYEGFVFTADCDGTSEVSLTRRVERGWHDYVRVRSVDDHLVLMLHDRSVTAVPWVALDEGDPEAAMGGIEEWMTAGADVPT
jgi:hypothetical protein